jgi:hypothetical protein
MRCNLWKEKAFPYVEGLLTGPQAEAYREHVGACPVCRAEVEAGRGLVQAIRRLRDPDLRPEEARVFDRTVLARAGVGAVPVGATADRALVREARVQAVLAAAAAGRARRQVPAADVRATAAHAIAARSRQAVRPASPPAPSFMLASLALVAASAMATLFFGEWMVRAIGSSFTLAFGALGEGGGRLAEAVGARVLETVAVFRVLRLLLDVGPVSEGMRQLASARAADVMLVTVLAVALLGCAGFLVRRGRGEARETVRR